MGNRDAGSGTPPIPLTGTGPFAPPDDLTLEELHRLLRIGIDLQTVSAANAVSTMRSTKPVKATDLKSSAFLADVVDSAFERLSGDAGILFDIAKRIGEAGFEEAFMRAGLKDDPALAALRAKATKVGGFVPFLVGLLSTSEGAFSADRARMKSVFDSIRNADLEEPARLASHDATLTLHISCSGAVSDIITGVAWTFIPVTTSAGMVMIGYGIAEAQFAC